MNFGLVPAQCISSMGGNWVTSRTFCKKIGARTNVLTIRNTYTTDVKIAVEITIRVKNEI